MLVWLSLGIFVIFFNFLIMEFYSLEEDDGNELFITQESWDSGDKVLKVNENDGLDYECPNLTQGCHAKYSDISDDDDFQIPSSQIVDNNKRTR